MENSYIYVANRHRLGSRAVPSGAQNIDRLHHIDYASNRRPQRHDI